MDVSSGERRQATGAVGAEVRVGFEDFFEAEHDRAVRRASLMLGDTDLAHDVVAAAMEQMWRRWDSIAEPGPYFHRCVVNGCRDVGRARSRVSLDDPPVNAADSDEATVDLSLLLLELPFRQRAALVLRFYEGRTERQIAEALNCRPGTVGPLISRGLQRLRKVMSE